MKIIFRVIACLFMLGGCCQSSLAQHVTNTGTEATKGKMDLRYNNLSAQPVPLNGEWSFYWKTLLQPGDSSPATHSYTQYPQLWSKTNLNGQPLSSQGYAS